MYPEIVILPEIGQEILENKLLNELKNPPAYREFLLISQSIEKTKLLS